MKLRKWQSECINKAIEHYSNGAQHFLALATPGAGKTICATRLARELVDRSMVDLVMCFSPTSIVALDFAESLSSEFNSRFDGKLGAMGHSSYSGSIGFLLFSMRYTTVLAQKLKIQTVGVNKLF